MIKVYLADGHPEERSALRLLIRDLEMNLIGEAADWQTVLAEVPISHVHMVLIDWDLLPTPPDAAVKELRKACPASLVIVLISHLDSRQQAARSAGADVFISRGEMTERVVDELRAVVKRFQV